MRRIALAVALVPFALCLAQPASAQQTQNHPPEWASDTAYQLETQHVRVDRDLTITIHVTDADHDPVTITVSGLPAGATLTHVPQAPGLAQIRWHPTEKDIGVYEVLVVASDGKESISRSVKIVVEDEWKTFFMPGLQYSHFMPARRSEWGTMQGVSAEILLAAWIARNDNRGPSHGRVYVDMDILFPSNRDKGTALDFTFGFDLSIERNPTRRFFLPYFGLKTGGFVQRDLEKGGFGHVTPLAGLYLWADKNLFVNLGAGYMMPINARYFDELRGLRATLGINYSLW